MPGSLYVVATPIGNLEDITLRALRILREVAIIAAEDTRRTAKLLSHYSISTPTTSVHAHNERQRLEMILRRLAGGEDVALVSDAGTPGISDPGRHVVEAALTRGFRVIAIPGPSAVTAALVSSGFPADSFVFAGFAPRRAKAREEWLRQIATDSRTVVFFEAPHRIKETLAAAARVLGSRRLAVARELTKLHEELVVGPTIEALGRLTEQRGEYTIVVSALSNGLADAPELPDDSSLLAEFGHITKNDRVGRRAAVAELSAKYRTPQREVYAAIERAKKSVG